MINVPQPDTQDSSIQYGGWGDEGETVYGNDYGSDVDQDKMFSFKAQVCFLYA